MANDPILDKVRNLLNLAENAGTDAEADLARERAEALMLKRGIDDAMLAAADDGDTDDITNRRITVPAPYPHKKAILLGAIADTQQVKVVIWTPKGGHARGITAEIVGYSRDLDRLEMLYTSLLMQASRQVMRQHAPRGGNTNSYRNSWLEGFTGTVKRRLMRLQKQAQVQTEAEGSTGTDLVLRDRKQAVDDEYRRLHPKMGKFKSRSTSHAGYRDGADAGEEADLEQTRMGGGATRALSH